MAYLTKWLTKVLIGLAALAAVAAILYLVQRYLLKRREHAADATLDQLSREDASWNPETIKRRAEEIFRRVCEAQTARDPTIVKDLVSESLFRERKADTDLLLRQQRKNILSDITINEIRPVEATASPDKSRDRVWVYISGSMANYVIDENIEGVVWGEKAPSSFEHLWKLVRGRMGWVAEQIDRNVTFADLHDVGVHRKQRIRQPSFLRLFLTTDVAAFMALLIGLILTVVGGFLWHEAGWLLYIGIPILLFGAVWGVARARATRRIFTHGMEIPGEITKMKLYSVPNQGDIYQLECAFTCENQTYCHKRGVAKNIASNLGLRPGGAVVLLVDPAHPKRAVIRDLYT